MIKLLIISPKPPPNGGISRWTILLCNWLASNNSVEYRHVDISPHWKPIYELGVIRRILGGIIQGAGDIFCVFRELVHYHPNVAHLTTSGSLSAIRDILILGVLKLFRVPSIYHIHFGRIPQLVDCSNLEWRLLRTAMCLSSSIIAIDRSTYDSLLNKFSAQKLWLIPNAVDVATYRAAEPSTLLNDPDSKALYPFAKNKHIVLFLGWVIPTKGITELLKSWNSINAPGWKLAIAGPISDSYRKALASVITDPASIIFTGNVSHELGSKLMALADIFVLPSYTEGFPNAILEAMCAGKAIIATSVGAIPEMLDASSKEPCGAFIKPRDHVALANTLQELINDHQLRLSLGLRANRRVKANYSTSVVFKQYEELWKHRCM